MAIAIGNRSFGFVHADKKPKDIFGDNLWETYKKVSNRIMVKQKFVVKEYHRENNSFTVDANDNWWSLDEFYLGESSRGSVCVGNVYGRGNTAKVLAIDGKSVLVEWTAGEKVSRNWMDVCFFETMEKVADQKKEEEEKAAPKKEETGTKKCAEAETKIFINFLSEIGCKKLCIKAMGADKESMTILWNNVDEEKIAKAIRWIDGFMQLCEQYDNTAVIFRISASSDTFSVEDIEFRIQ